MTRIFPRVRGVFHRLRRRRDYEDLGREEEVLTVTFFTEDATQVIRERHAKNKFESFVSSGSSQ